MNPFVGWDQTKLEGELAKAQADYASGRMVTDAMADNASTRKQVQVPALERIRALLRALNVINPATYPLSQTARVNRTKLVVYPQGVYFQ